MAIELPKEHQATVVLTKKLSPKIILLGVKPAQPISFIAGQYASFLIDTKRRPLSFASLNTDPTLEFIVDISPHGVCSNYVEQLKSGDTIRWLSPYGRFIVPVTLTRPLLFIATGSGIAPIRAQIRDVLSRPTPVPITLFFGNRNEQYMFLTEEFEELAAQHLNFTFTPILSEPSATWQGERGLVTTVVPQKIAQLPDWSAYVCGNPGMVKDTMTMLLGHGMLKEHIHSEQFTETKS